MDATEERSVFLAKAVWYYHTRLAVSISDALRSYLALRCFDENE